MKFAIIAFSLFLLQFIYIQEIKAQRGNNQIAIGAEIGPVIAQYSGFRYQVGMPVKGYYGTGKNGQFLLRTGLHSFVVPQKNLFSSFESIRYYMLPLAVGYRKNINRYYVEGSLGAARSSNIIVSASPTQDTFRSSLTEIHYGLEFGYQIKRFDIGFSVNNTGPIPYNLFFSGFKALYKFEL